jgi:hypothetical protein
MADDWSDENTDNPLLADDRNYYKVEKWTKDGMKVDRMHCWQQSTPLSQPTAVPKHRGVGLDRYGGWGLPSLGGDVRSGLAQQYSGRVHAHVLSFSRQGRRGVRGIAMSEQIKLPIISRRKVFWLAAIAAALAAPATMLSTSNARAQQSDQAPAAEPTAPKTKEKKKKKKQAAPKATTAPASNPPAPPKQQ